MKKRLIYLLIFVSGCLPVALSAYHSPNDSIQSVAKAGRIWSKIFNRKIQVNIGFDLEPTRNTRINAIGIVPIVNVGASYDFNLNEQWTVRPEIWYQQFTTPRLTLITYTKSQPDELRIQISDTLSLLRMAGYNLGFSVKRHLPIGLSIFGGLQCGWYKKGVSESGSLAVDMSGSIVRHETSSFPDYAKIPDWFNGVQPGIKFGLEKVFLKRIVIGASVYQGLTDITDFPEGGKNFSTNYLGYVGIKL